MNQDITLKAAIDQLLRNDALRMGEHRWVEEFKNKLLANTSQVTIGDIHIICQYLGRYDNGD